jgi:hypothetical protein
MTYVDLDALPRMSRGELLALLEPSAMALHAIQGRLANLLRSYEPEFADEVARLRRAQKFRQNLVVAVGRELRRHTSESAVARPLKTA